jgi:hypothetical protein
METQRIKSEDWVEYFNQFSRDHLGWLTSVEVLDKQSGPQRVAENMPLQGISFDTSGTRASAIDISLGDDPSSHVNHVIDMALHIRRADPSEDCVDLQIEPARGPVTLIHLSKPN